MTDNRGLAVRISDFLTKITATFFGIGYAPLAPGSLGSAAGLLAAWICGPHLVLGLIAFTCLGFLVCKPAVKVLSSEDPKSFVMDEVCGMMISVVWLPRTLGLYVIAFILFRVFDIYKPWPISRIQRWRSPSAIMWDDVLAGVFTNLLIRVFLLIRL